MDLFDTQDRVVIRLIVELTKVLLVRRTLGGKTYFSVKEGDAQVRNMIWESPSAGDRMLLSQFQDRDWIATMERMERLVSRGPIRKPLTPGTRNFHGLCHVACAFTEFIILMS